MSYEGESGTNRHGLAGGIRLAGIIWASLLFLLSATVFAQDAVPTEMLQRTLFIRVGKEMGTGFTLDHHGELYLVTARHVVRGVPERGAKLDVWKNGGWTQYATVKTLYPASSRVDIAVFDTGVKAARPFRIVPSAKGSGGVTFGERVWFLGYPWGIATQVKGTRFPFIKSGTFSAVDYTDDQAPVIYIDGFNNPGFSGGPIIFWDFSTHSYKILGVVMGYRVEAAKALVNGMQVETNVLENSGILIGYSIMSAVEAIEKDKPQ